MYLSTPMLENENGNLRIQFPRRPFNRIRRVLPDAASRHFHATRLKPQSRKPAWLPFYTGDDSSLQSDLSAFIFRLPRGQQREQPHRANPTDLRHPCGTTDALIVPKHSGIKPFSASTADASLRSSAGFEPATCGLTNRCSTIELASYKTCASGGVINFWFTLCHTPLVLPVPGHTELQDFRRNARTVSLDSAERCPVTSGSTHQPLLAKARTGGLPLSLHCRCLA